MNGQNFIKTNPDICFKNTRNVLGHLRSHLTSPSAIWRKTINLITYHCWGYEVNLCFWFFQISASISTKIVTCKVWCWYPEKDQWQNPFAELCNPSWNIKLFLLSARKKKKYFAVDVMEKNYSETWKSRFVFKTWLERFVLFLSMALLEL